MTDFNDLPRTTQAERLHGMAERALTHYALTPMRVSLAGYDTNATFRVEVASGEVYALRITSPYADHPLDETRAELAFLRYLTETTDIIVPQPIPTTSDELCILETAHGVPEPRTCTLFTWLPGSILADDITPEVYVKLGDLMARLHIAAAAWQQPESLRKINRVFYFNDPILLFSHSELYREAADRVQTGLDALWNADPAARVIHADLHPWNVMSYRGKLSPFDFEDLMLGYPVQDVAISLYYIRSRPDVLPLTSAFREGYERHLPWPTEADFQLHFVHRALMLYNFCLTVDATAWGESIAAWLDGVLPGWLLS